MEADTSDEADPNERGRHPPHLRGKAIGMFYAHRNRGRGNRGGGTAKSRWRHKKDLLQRSTVVLDQNKEKEIVHLLGQVPKSEPVETASTSSSASIFFTQYKSHLAQSKLSDGTSPCEDYDPAVHTLQRNPALDRVLLEDLISKKKNSQVCKMLSFRRKLPAFKMQEEIIDTIERNQVVVISGETGCGKTTQVTQFILDSYIKDGRGSICKIVCTQPRRISAITVAERVADERGETCNANASVGWQIRLENKLPRECGSILYCTTGITLQRLQNDWFLAGVSHIVLDEIHERDLDTDFLLIILRDLLLKRADLKLILMSATLNAEAFAVYFDNCPMIHIPGFTFPVKEYLLEDVLEMTGYIPPPNNNRTPRWQKRKMLKRTIYDDDAFEEYLQCLTRFYSPSTIEVIESWNEDYIDLDLMFCLISHVCRNEKDGAILVFLPGWDMISKLHQQLTDEFPFNTSRFLIIPLHSMMPTIAQKAVFDRPPPGVRKIIIATNIAETSITIDDVVFVIDCGKIKISNFDEESNIATLQPEWVALANAHQRRGRAGRVQPGICYHLYSKYRECQLEQYQLPEMLRTRLETLILKIKILKLGKVEPFLQKALNPPSPKVVALSLALLKDVNALDSNEYLTPLGYHLARLPLDPLTGRMILFGAMFSCLDPILTVAASLSFKDAFYVPLGMAQVVDKKKQELACGSKSDHLMLARALKEWELAERGGRGAEYCRKYFLSAQTLRMLVKLKKQFAEYLETLKFLHCGNPKHTDFNKNSGNAVLLKAIVCAGLYPNVAKLTKKSIRKKRQAVMRTKEDGWRVLFHPKSVNSPVREFDTQWIVYYQKVKSTGVYLHDTTEVLPYALLFFGGKISTEMDGEHETVVIDDWIRFHCAKKTADLVMVLRDKLDKVLEYKICNPGVLRTDIGTEEGAVLNSIIKLITSEGCNQRN